MIMTIVSFSGDGIRDRIGGADLSFLDRCSHCYIENALKLRCIDYIENLRNLR